MALPLVALSLASLVSSVVSFVFSEIVIKFTVLLAVFLLVTLLFPFVISFLSPFTGANFLSAFSSIPAHVWFFIDFFALDVGLPILISAHVSRFLIRRLPLIG